MMSSSTFTFVLDYCLFGIHVFKDVFDGALLEVLIGVLAWLFFLALTKKKPPTKAKDHSLSDGSAEASAKPFLPAVDLNSSARSAPSQHIAVAVQAKSPAIYEAEEVHEFVAYLLSRSARQAPVAVLERYDKLVRLHGVDLHQHLEGTKQAYSLYLALAACGKGKRCPGGASWTQRILSDMRKFNFPRSLDFYTSLAKLYANDRRSGVLSEIYGEMTLDGIAADRGLLICFMNAAVASDESAQALRCFDELKKLEPPSMRTCMTVLGVYKRDQDCSGAIRLLEDIRPDALVLNQVLGLCIEAGRVLDAEDLLQRWHGQSDVISCNTLMKGYTQQADLPKAEMMLQRMLTNGPRPNLVTLNTIMDCSVRSLHCCDPLQRGGGKRDRSATHSDSSIVMRELTKRPWVFLDLLIQLDLKPDRYTCSILVKGMHYSGADSPEIDRATEILREVGPGGLQGLRLGDRTNNLRLVEVLFNTLLDICASSHDLDRIINIFEMMKEFKVDITSVTFGILIKAFGQAGRLSRCHEVWQGMLDASVRPTVVTFGCYIDACIRNNDMSRAEHIFSSMAATKVRPNAVVYTSVIRGLASIRATAKALKLYGEMRRDGVEPTSVTFNSVLDMVARQVSEPDILQSVLADMHAADAAPDAVVCVMLIKACCSNGNVDNAMTFFRQIHGKGVMYDHAAMNSLLLACSRLDRIEDAEEVFEGMCQLGIAPSNMAMVLFVKMYSRARLPRKAEAVVELIQRDLGARPNLQVYASLIQALIQNRCLQRGLETFHKMTRSGIEADALTCSMIVQACIKLQQFDQALDLAKHTSVRMHLELLQNLHEAMRHNGYHVLAVELNALMCQPHRCKRTDSL